MNRFANPPRRWDWLLPRATFKSRAKIGAKVESIGAVEWIAAKCRSRHPITMARSGEVELNEDLTLAWSVAAAPAAGERMTVEKPRKAK